MTPSNRPFHFVCSMRIKSEDGIAFYAQDIRSKCHQSFTPIVMIFFIIEMNTLDFWGIFKKVFFGLFVSLLFYFNAKFKKNHSIFMSTHFCRISKLSLLINIQNRGELGKVEIYSECVATAKFIPTRKGCCVHLSSACSSVRV